jgi:O-antigen/teichoic acid export membrane protein
MNPPEQIATAVQEQPAGVAGEHRLLSRILHGSFWMLNSNLFSRVLNLARGVILARLLVPDDFGLYGLATVIIGFTAMFSDIGAGAFLVYCQDRVDEHVDTAFWANTGIASLLSLAVLGSAPIFARVYHRPDLVPVLAVLSLCLWLQMVTTVHRNLVRRDLRFRALATVDAAIALTTFAVAVALAWRGGGVWSFVISLLAGNFISAFLLFSIYRWVPRWRFSRISFAMLMPFSGWYVGQAIVWYLVLNVDNLLVGKFLGIEALGIYGLAYNYSLLPVSLVGITLGNVVYAELPRLYSDPPRFWSAFFLSSRLLASLSCPLAAALVICSPDIFPLLFGPKWIGAIRPFQILAVYGAIRGIWMDPFGSLGKFHQSFWLAIGTLVVSTTAIYFAIPYGKTGVAVAVLFTAGAANILNLYIVSFDRWKEGLRNAVPYFLTATFAALVAVAARQAFAWMVSDQKAWLAFVSLTTLLLVYAAVLHRELREYLTVFMSKHPIKDLRPNEVGS